MRLLMTSWRDLEYAEDNGHMQEQAAIIMTRLIKCIHTLQSIYVNGLAKTNIRFLKDDALAHFLRTSAAEFFRFAQQMAPIVQQLRSGRLVYDGEVSDRNLACLLYCHGFRFVEDAFSPSQHFWLPPCGLFSLRMHASRDKYALTVGILDPSRPVFLTTGDIHPDLFNKNQRPLELLKLTAIEAAGLVIPARHAGTTCKLWNIDVSHVPPDEQVEKKQQVKKLLMNDAHLTLPTQMQCEATCRGKCTKQCVRECVDMRAAANLIQQLLRAVACT